MVHKHFDLMDLTVDICDGGGQPYDLVKDGTTGWFSPREYLRGLEGVVKADYVDTTSSAGDWCGWFAVEMDRGYDLIEFSQENRFPDDGYTLYTGSKPFASVTSLDDEVLDEIIGEYLLSFDNPLSDGEFEGEDYLDEDDDLWEVEREDYLR